MPKMLINYRKTSLVDYPGKVAAVLFFRFCNLTCPWCHNQYMFKEAETAEQNNDTVDLEAALAHIEKRANVLGGVVISGGEPTLYKKLPALIKRIKAAGLAVKLDTNGTNPKILKSIFSDDATRPNYIACDLKLSPERYAQLGGGYCPPGSKSFAYAKRFSATPRTSRIAESLIKSAELIKTSGIDHEFRSLVLPPDIFSEADIINLAPLAGSSRWVFRPFKPASHLPVDWQNKNASTAASVQKAALFARSLGANAVNPS